MYNCSKLTRQKVCIEIWVSFTCKFSRSFHPCAILQPNNFFLSDKKPLGIALFEFVTVPMIDRWAQANNNEALCPLPVFKIHTHSTPILTSQQTHAYTSTPFQIRHCPQVRVGVGVILYVSLYVEPHWQPHAPRSHPSPPNSPDISSSCLCPPPHPSRPS